MISIKRYLEQENAVSGRAPARPEELKREASPGAEEPETGSLLDLTAAAYRSALLQMGNCGQDVCPYLGEALKQGMARLGKQLAGKLTPETVAETESGVQAQMQNWGRQASTHYRQQAKEVKEMLLVMARAAESVGERDQRCAGQFAAVTTRLQRIASLEDLTEIRESIKKSALDLKSSIDRMTAEGKAAIEGLRAEISNYQARLEEAEQIASRDALSGLSNRMWVEGQLERCLQAAAPFCVALLDIDQFKRVNDEHGHLVGDELLRQFAAKMRSVCRTTDTAGRWGGDEFLILLHCRLPEAQAEIDRLREWVCCNYTLEGRSAPVKLHVSASIGLAERLPGETLKELIGRADAEMYRQKTAARDLRDNTLRTR
ncbi:MAG: GGDEF domain-containing protein [Terracidiphilus sp.]